MMLLKLTIAKYLLHANAALRIISALVKLLDIYRATLPMEERS
jgi:hypothetical protein